MHKFGQSFAYYAIKLTLVVLGAKSRWELCHHVYLWWQVATEVYS